MSETTVNPILTTEENKTNIVVNDSKSLENVIPTKNKENVLSNEKECDSNVEDARSKTKHYGEALVKSEYLVPKSVLEARAKTMEEEEALKEKENPIENTEGKSSFKKRPRDAKVDPSTLLCLNFTSDKGCNLGEQCKFSHDVSDYMKRREKDLGTSCPVFNARGYCRFGLSCRFGSSHFDFKEMKNLHAEKKENYTTFEEDELNGLNIKIRDSLRKKKYPFMSKSWKNDKKSKKQEKMNNIDENTNEISETPLLKERKLIDFRGKVYIAPLTTVGNLPYRRVMKQLGADITCGEMAMASNLLQGQASEWALLRRHKSEDVFGVQIAGSFGDQMSRCCELISRETDVDFIDINMGCPIDLVCRTGAGSALMRQERKLQSVVQGSLTGIELGSYKKEHVPALTVKMRTGWDTKHSNAHKLVSSIQGLRGSSEFLNRNVTQNYTLRSQLGVEAVTIHGRSRQMRYTKTADWDYICYAADSRNSDLENASHMAVIGGGDVLSYEEFHQHLENGKLDTCMIARGALIKPWLPTEIKEKRHWDISASERLDLLKDFVKFGLEHWGSDQKGINSTRRFLLEWLSFLCRYIPVGLLERVPQHINERPPVFYGRNDLETLMGSECPEDWIKLSEMLLGPVPENFRFEPKHKANSYAVSRDMSSTITNSISS